LLLPTQQLDAHISHYGCQAMSSMMEQKEEIGGAFGPCHFCEQCPCESLKYEEHIVEECETMKADG